MDAHDNNLEQHLAVLAANPADVDALIGLARLGARAHHAAPVVIRSIGAVQEPRFRAICIDALGAVLEDRDDDEAREAVVFLAQAMEDPAYHRMRGKIARTLHRIGLAARDAIPALARTLASGLRGSVRVPLKRMLIGLAWLCWMDESADVQQCIYKILEGFSRPYRIWILGVLLEDHGGGKHIRGEALLLQYELKRLMVSR